MKIDENFYSIIEQKKKDGITKEQKKYNFKSWVTFFRQNLDIFVEDFLEIPVHMFQKNMFAMLQDNDITTFVCSRGSSKSFCASIIAVCYMLLYPNCTILVTSLTLSQSNLIISSKIDKELSNLQSGISPILRQLRKDGWITFGKDQNTGGLIVSCKNGSIIKSCALGESMRGNRAQIVILDEAAICSKKLYQTCAEPTLSQRIFVGRPNDYVEEPKQIFLSSARSKTNWLWKQLINCVVGYYKKGRIKYGFMCVDALSGVASKIQTPNQYLQRKKNTDDLTFRQEYLNEFLGTSENSIFKLEDFEVNQTLENPFYLKTLDDILDDEKYKYDFSNDKEIRIVVCDIALATGNENDNSVWIFMSINKETNERKVENVIPKNGLNTVTQVKLMKRFFYEYKAHYLMMDVKGVGQGVYDLLTVETIDPEFATIYPAWTVCKDSSLQITSDTVMNDKIQRTISVDAEEVIIPYAGTSELNTQLHLSLRKALKDRNISFLKDESIIKAKIEDEDSKFFTRSSEYKAQVLLPFLQTKFMINEAISLEVKFSENGNIKLQEAKRTDVKDRYMTLAMGNLLADKIFNKYHREDEEEDIDLEDWQWLKG